MNINVVDLGLDINHTDDIEFIKYWNPEVVVFDNEETNETMFVITLEKNMHSLVFKNALRNKTKISVAGSLGSSPSFWLSVDDYTMIIEVDLTDEVIKNLKHRKIVFYFYEIDHTCVGSLRIKS